MSSKNSYNNFFENKNYPIIMFLAIITLSIILLFSFINFVEDVNKGLTTYAIQQQADEYKQQQNITPNKEILENMAKELESEQETEVYTMQAWSIFYIIIIVVIILVAVLSITLKRTIQKNIKQEDEIKKEIMR